MNTVQVDLLTVVIAAVLNMIIGFFWYSKWLFGPEWMKEHKGHVEGKHMKSAMAYAFVASLVIAYFLALFEGYVGVTTVTDGMFVGFCAWLGFVATTQISSVIWCRHSFKGFLIDTSGKLVSFLVMSGVIGA